MNVVVHNDTGRPIVTGLCVGYEDGMWRYGQLSHWLFEHVPSFALKHSEYKDFDGEIGVELMGQAVRKIYQTKKYSKRGEFGELLLHAVLQETFGTLPAISKLYFKDSSNDTVKGFDAVHIVAPSSGPIELWLGEVKFYKNLNDAIRDIVKELALHTTTAFLKGDFLAIAGKLDPSWPRYAELKSLLDDRVELSKKLKQLTIPVLLTYDSDAVDERVIELNGMSTGDDPESTYDAYQAVFESEIIAGLAKFVAKPLPAGIKIHLILVPLHRKKSLVAELHGRLMAWQMATAGTRVSTP